MRVLLEIAVFNIESAIAAATAGAHRIELCENPSEGGTTPSYGTLKTVREHLSIPVFPIIRPRGGDFLYSTHEYAVMQKDALLCKELGFEGVVIGLLQAGGHVDTVRTSQLVEMAYPMDVTFHRAFDRTIDPLKALEDIIDCGCTRILTSGQVPQAFQGKELLKTLVEKADNRITILPGSGVRSSNIKELIVYTGATEMHSSARIQKDSAMQYQKASMQEDMHCTQVDLAEIQSMCAILNSLQ